MEQCVFERMDNFWQNMGMRAAWFLENGHFSDKIWAWEQSLFHEKSAKRVSYWVFVPLYTVVLTELTFFDQIWAWQQVFYMKKMIWEHCVFKKMEVFYQNMGLKVACFLWIDVFWTKYGYKKPIANINFTNFELKLSKNLALEIYYSQCCYWGKWATYSLRGIAIARVCSTSG